MVSVLKRLRSISSFPSRSLRSLGDDGAAGITFEARSSIGRVFTGALRLPVNLEVSLCTLISTRVLGSNGDGLPDGLEGRGSCNGGMRRDGCKGKSSNRSSSIATKYGATNGAVR